MQSHIFAAMVEPDKFEDGTPAYHAWCPALKGCHTWGHTEQEALSRLNEAVELYVDDLRASGKPIPVDPDRGAIAMPSPAVLVNL